MLNAFLEQTSENNNAAAAAIVVDAAAIGAIVAGADVVDGVVPAITAVVAVSSGTTSGWQQPRWEPNPPTVLAGASNEATFHG